MSNLYLRERTTAVIRALREATFQPLPTQEVALTKLRDVLPPEPVVVDVGANIGRWTTALLESFPAARVVMVEPQAELADGLKKMVAANHNLQLVSKALAAEKGERTFYVSLGDRHHSGSSLRPELTGVKLEERTVVTETLDDVLSSLDFPPVDFLKLDTQGSELDILSGASATIASAKLVQLEVSLVPYNEGAPVLADVIATMSDHGFYARDMFDLMYLAGTGNLVQVNVIFGREVRALDQLR
jgi:FkbM family methyltransferase